MVSVLWLYSNIWGNVLICYQLIDEKLDISFILLLAKKMPNNSLELKTVFRITGRHFLKNL